MSWSPRRRRHQRSQQRHGSTIDSRTDDSRSYAPSSEDDELPVVREHMESAMKDFRRSRVFYLLLAWISVPLWILYIGYMGIWYLALQVCDTLFVALDRVWNGSWKDYQGQVWVKLSNGDLAWSEMDAHHNNHMIINSIIAVEPMKFSQVRDLVVNRWIANYSRFSSVLVKRGLSTYFKSLGDSFDPDKHFVDVCKDDTPWDKIQLRRYVEQEMEKPLDPHKPLWQVHFVRNYVNEKGEHCSAIIIRTHHVLADGIALVRLLLEALADKPPAISEGKLEREENKHKKRQLDVPRWEWVLRGVLLCPLYFISKFFTFPDRSRLHGPDLNGRRRIAWIDNLQMGDGLAMKECLSKVTGRKITLNDLLVGILGTSMKRYVEKRNSDRDAAEKKRWDRSWWNFIKSPLSSRETLSDIHISVPVNLRPQTSRLVVNNKFAILLPKMFLEPQEGCAVTGRASLDNIISTHRQFDFLKNSGLPISSMFILEMLMAAQPRKISDFIFDTLCDKCSAVLTNVPGPRHTLSLDGTAIKDMIFWAPGRYNIGITISIYTYCDSIHFGINTDTAVIADPDALVSEIEKEFHQTMKSCEHHFPETMKEARRVVKSKMENQ